LLPGGQEAAPLRLTTVLALVLLGSLSPLLAQPAAPQPADQQHLAAPGTPLDITADVVRYYQPQRLVTASGNVRATYQDLEVNAQELVADLEAQTATLTGQVRLLYRGQVFTGSSIFVDLRTRLWEFRQAASSLTPDFFGQGVVAPLFVDGQEVTGGGPQVVARQGAVTTCNRALPHYHLEARRITIYPGRRLVARDASFWIGRHRLFNLPSFHVRLQQRERVPIVPEVGENEIDGRYLKTRYQYDLTDAAPGSLLLDVMEKRGFGKGLDQGYGWARALGGVYLYHVANRSTGENELVARSRHQQDLGGGLVLRTLADYRQNSGYYLPGSTLVNNTLSLDRTRPSAASRLGISYNRNQGYTDYSALLASLDHVQNFGTARTLTLGSTFQQHDIAPGLPEDVEINNRIQIVDRHHPYDLTLDVAKRLDPDSYTGDSFYQVLDRLPQLTLETTSYRLPALGLLGVPARGSMSVGEFFERPTDLRAGRLALTFDSLPTTYRLTPSTRLSGQAGLRQTFYQDPDHTAQYAYNTTANLDQQFSHHWSLRTNYYLLKPKGYTPFRFDYVGNYQAAGASLNFDNGPAGRASLVTGFDLETSTWRNLQGRLNQRLSPTVSLALASTYNLNRGEAQDLSALGQLVDRRTAWLLGLRYDPRTSQWRRITSDLAWQVTDKWRIQSISGWDGGTRQFIYNEVLVVRDLHCWEALFYYSRSRRLFRLDLRIKAFEWGRRDFGVTRSGQYISPLPPEIY